MGRSQKEKEITRDEKEVVARKCYNCGGEMHGTRTYYHYAECGLDTINLENVLVFRCSRCSAIVPEIPAMAELHRVILLAIIQKNSLLSGPEIRFLRKMAGMSSKELAQSVGANPSSLSRWEQGTRKITKKMDSTLRLICFAGMLQDILKEKDLVPKISEVAQRLSELDIRKILARVRDLPTGPIRQTIDPNKLAEFGGELGVHSPLQSSIVQ
jgi:putative zinc finger/helix-turn-helix YgiT family protein